MTRPSQAEGAPLRRTGAPLAAALVAATALAALATALPAAEPAGDTGLDPAYYPTGIEAPAPASGGISLVGLLQVPLLAGFVAGVLYVVNWVFADTRFVGADRERWSPYAIVLGLVSLAAVLLVPWFYVGLPLGLVVFGGGALVYVGHRNAKVTAPLRVMTAAHLARLGRGGKGAAAKEAREGAAELDVTFIGYDDIPRTIEAEDVHEDRARYDIERTVQEGAVRGASIVGYLVRPQKSEVRYRIGSDMVAGGELELPVAEAISRAVKRLAELDPNETRKPQEGRLRAVIAGRTYDLRIKTSGTVRGEQVAIRLRDMAATQFRIEDLGLTEDQAVALRDALQQRPGLVLLSGPKNSGVTTTLHACLRHLDRYINNVIAFEPKVDLTVENVEHIPLDQEDGPVAVSEVRSRLRHEPDVVGFDSLYDVDVAHMLAEAAQERSLVLTIRAGDTSQALSRLAALLGDTSRLAQALQVVLTQRLVRLLCPECKEAYRPNPEFLRKANLAAQAVDTLYRPPARPKVNEDGQVVVCPKCRNQRYVGRTGLFELMPIDQEARDMIARGALADLRTYCRKLGMRNLQEEGLRLVTDGQTSVEEVLRAIKVD
ncbi:MAG: Flp pilus assembly complex ATPase component TadA [Planctomycetes bacterium]|nr:Flp pilus assembly complex ATPase component TadA [Planctomycetota bacterium]